MFKIILVLIAANFVMTAPAYAEKWSAIGILTTQVKGEEAVARYVEIDDFESEEMCAKVVLRESQSGDYIGKGGTNGRVPEVQWNYDAACIQKRTY